jgi:hypothetical protein
MGAAFFLGFFTPGSNNLLTPFVAEIVAAVRPSSLPILAAPEKKTMPRLVSMTWIKSQRRWTKMYRGQRVYVSPKELGCLPTQEASVQAANAWWARKQAELDAAHRPDPQLTARLAALDALLAGPD